MTVLGILQQVLLLLCFAVLCTEFSPVISSDIESKRNDCLTEDDLDFESCDLHHLPITALKAICERLGLDVEDQIFPYLFESDDDEPEIDGERSSDKDTKQSKERSYDDYVEAAKECISIEMEMEEMLENDEQALDEFEKQMLDEDPDLLSDIMTEVLMKSPGLVERLEETLKKEDPELFAELFEELGEDEEHGMKTLSERPELVAELITEMLAENPALLQELDGDDLSSLAEEDTLDAYMDMIGEEDAEMDEELIEELKKRLGTDEL